MLVCFYIFDFPIYNTIVLVQQKIFIKQKKKNCTNFNRINELLND